VDDDDSIRQVVSLALADEGYQVDAAGDGEAALQLVRRQRPDLILLDMRMPVMDGNQFARAYRGLPGPHAPIIAFVAAFDAAEHGEAIGAAAVLEKPFDLDDLLDMVGQLLRNDPEGAPS
jgi:CheY-like chemotaxis protein